MTVIKTKLVVFYSNPNSCFLNSSESGAKTKYSLAEAIEIKNKIVYNKNSLAPPRLCEHTSVMSTMV
jgi:hypothetical protein